MGKSSKTKAIKMKSWRVVWERIVKKKAGREWGEGEGVGMSKKIDLRGNERPEKGVNRATQPG